MNVEPVIIPVSVCGLRCPSGDVYLQRVANSRQKIAQVANPFIRDGTVYFSRFLRSLLACTTEHRQCALYETHNVFARK